MATNWEQLAEPESQPEPPLFDPYYTVAVKAAFLGVKPASVPILLELTTTVAEFTALAWDSDGRTKQWLAFPEMFRKPPAPLDQATFCVAIVEQAFFKEIKTYEPLKRRVRRFEAGPPVRNMKTVFDLNELPSAGTTGMSRQKTASQPSNANAAAPSRSQAAAAGPAASFDGVVVGVIDDGLAFANERFCTYNAGVRASRIESFWGQDLAPNPKYGYGASSGHVFPRVAIDQLLQDALVGNAVDEDRLYQLAGYSFGVPGHKSTARRAAHGTHVMDLACGFEPRDAAGLKRRIVAVQLPTIVTEQTSGLLLRPYVVKAVWHIVLTALNLSTATNKVPVVINLSYGMTSGPHDGTGTVERALDQLVSLCTAFGMRLTIVVPSGNGHLMRVHATAALPPGLPVVPVQWSWRALPDDRTPSFLEIWMPCDASFNEIQFEVETPTGDRSGRITEGSAWLWSKGRQRALVLYPGFQSLGSRRMALVVLWPTASVDRNAPLTSPSGTWKVHLYNTGSQPRVVDGRVMRDDNAFGFPTVGRQSRFEDHNYARFDRFGLPRRRDPGGSVVVRAGSINGLATGARTVVVGGCRASDLHVVPYSGAGPVERPHGCGMATRLGPDVLAPCETSVGHGGILAGGTRSNSTIAMSGTSVAAPQVTRVLANHLETYGVGDRTTIWWEAVLQVVNRFGLGWVPPLAGWPAPDDGFGQVEVPNGALPAANAMRPPQYRP